MYIYIYIITSVYINGYFTLFYLYINQCQLFDTIVIYNLIVEAIDVYIIPLIDILLFLKVFSDMRALNYTPRLYLP